MKVRIYWNLHQGMWSVQDAKTRRVIGHATQILVRDASFVVSEAGRQRVLRERKKNVHAFVVGELEAAIWFSTRDAMGSLMFDWRHCTRANNAYRDAANKYGKAVTYNPFKGPTFVEVFSENGVEERRDILKADMVYLTWENRGSTTPKSRVLAFDPCAMTATESARATQ